MRACLGLLLAAALTTCQAQPTGSSAPSAPPGAAPPAPMTPDGRPRSPLSSGATPRAAEIKRAVEFCTAGADANERLPLLVALHGLGDRPESFATLFRNLPARARVIVPEALDPYHDGFSWFPIDLWKPDPVRVGEGVRHAADAVARAMTRWQDARPTRGKPVVVGYSQGGMLSFELAVHHPELVQAAFAVAGWLPPPLVPIARPTVPTPPILALHGEDDDLLPIGPTRESVAALKGLGYQIELVPFAHTAHHMSPDMKAELEQRLVAALADR